MFGLDFVVEKVQLQNVTILTIFFLLGSSLYIRILLQLFGQHWIKTIAHTATLCILPIITYIITSVISGNIALSLGMVGALSIVRFRNPVRSPLELSVYFGAITMGITASASIQWGGLLLASVTLTVVVLFIANLISRSIYGNSFFRTSFSEGNQLSTLAVTSEGRIEVLENNEFLMSKRSENEVWTYMLSSNDFLKLKELDSILEPINNITSKALTK